MLALLSALLLAGLVCSSAQMLARPGWAGSGVVPEAWWRRAVFYRLDVVRFQDSDGHGRGDLAGVTARLDYLQSLGVDALLLDGSSQAAAEDDAGALETLVREASRRQIRLVMTASPAMQAGDLPRLLATVHEWLSAGVAGIWVPKPAFESAQADASYASLLTTLTTALRAMPGRRILLSEPAPPLLSSGQQATHAHRRVDSRQFEAGAVGQLTTAAVLPVQRPQVEALRHSLLAIASENAPSAAPLLRFAGDPETGGADAGIAATLLLASRGAAMFDFGDEIGLNAYPSSGVAARAALPVMQWTPVNVQQAPIERPAHRVVVTPPGDVTPFGAYRPYVRPSAAPAGRLPHRAPDATLPEPLPDPNTLPGFTRGSLPVEPVDGVRINVASEERDPNSLLNAYRQLIALHHENATVRNGTQYVLDRDAQDALVWVRRAPGGSRTVADVIVAANIGDKPVTLQIDDDLEHLGMRSGALRALFTWSPDPLTGETTGALILPPHAVFIGEVRRGSEALGRSRGLRR